jgi:hypothetical protein
MSCHLPPQSHRLNSPSAHNAVITTAQTPSALKEPWPLPYMMQEHQSTRRVMSPDSHLEIGERQYLDCALGAPLKSLKTVSTVATSTMTPPCAPPPLHSRGACTATATVTALHNVLASSHKCSTMRCVTVRSRCHVEFCFGFEFLMPVW